jgi:hypothetical protein
MFRAEQQRLFQETNVELVQLRHLEISYYFNVNSAIGTQAALIGGFIYGLFTQTIPRDNVYADYFLSAYYITSTIALFASIHIVMNTMLVQIFGPGLALHGPAGSMALAAETMREEMGQVIISFMIMIIFFAIATVLCFWVVMDIYSAIIGSGCFFIAARQWIFYGKRIYWRLFLDKSKVGNIFEDVVGPDPINPVLLNKGLSTTESRQSENRGEETRRSSFMGSIIPGPLKRKSKRNNAAVDVDEGLEIRESGTFETATNPKSIACEGYLMKKTPSNVSHSWEKRYYVLNFAGVMAPFASQDEYKGGQPSTLKERPLDIDDFFIHMDASSVDYDVSDKASTVASDKSASEKSKKGALKIFFESKDIQDNRRIVFRCETLEDADLWMDTFAKVAPSSMKV